MNLVKKTKQAYALSIATGISMLLGSLMPLQADAVQDAQSLAQAAKTAQEAAATEAATPAGTVRYGDKIQIQHPNTGWFLAGSKTPLNVGANRNGARQTPSGQWRAECKPNANQASTWIVKGPHKDGDRWNCVKGAPVKNGDIIRLEWDGIGANLHSHPLFAQLTGGEGFEQTEVTLYGSNGNGDTNDNWKVNGSLIQGSPVRLIHVNNTEGNFEPGFQSQLRRSQGRPFNLHSHHSRYDDQSQEVTTTVYQDGNDPFVVIKIEQCAETVAAIQSAAANAQATAAALAAAQAKRPPLFTDTFPALAYLREGLTVAIKSHAFDKYLRIEDGNTLKATGTDRNDPACQFTIRRWQNFVGFKSVALEKSNGNKSNVYLQPGNFVILGDSPNFGGDADMWEQFAIQPADPNSLKKVFIQGKASKSYWTAFNPANPGAWDKGCTWGAMTEGWAAIQTGAAQEFAIEVISQLPTGFSYEPGSFEKIACGRTQTGKLLAYGLDEDGDVLVRNNKPATATSQLWNNVQLQNDQGQVLKDIEDIAIASDGSGLVLDKNDKPYSLDTKTNKLKALAVSDIGASFTDCAIGNKTTIWLLNSEQGELFQFNGKAFVRRESGNASAIAAALDGSVVKLDKNGAPFMLGKTGEKEKTLAWSALGTAELEEIAIASKDKIVGINKAGAFVMYVDGTWATLPSTALDEISINANGDIFITNLNTDVCSKLIPVKGAPVVKPVNVKPGAKVIKKATPPAKSINPERKPVLHNGRPAKAISKKKAGKKAKKGAKAQAHKKAKKSAKKAIAKKVAKKNVAKKAATKPAKRAVAK
jgi:hypothetical protein